MARKPLEYLQNAFFGKISGSEWVNISLRGTELNADFGRNASATVPVEVFHSSAQDAAIRGKELN